MAINITGNTGDVYVNGKKIDLGNIQNGESSNFEKKESVSGDGINAININSNFSFKIIADKTATEITAQLSGTGSEDSIQLSVVKSGTVAEIRATSESSCDNITIGNFGGISIGSVSSGNMVISSGSGTTIISGGNNASILKIIIPAKEYDSITASSKNGNIEINDPKIQSRKISAETKNGNIDIWSTFEVLETIAKNGNIDVQTEAKSDIRLDVDTKNGNAAVILHNIKESRVRVDSKNGRASDRPRLGGTYTASGYVESKNGNVQLI